MNLLDGIILIILVMQALHGARMGFSLSFFSLAGFWAGLFAGALVVPFAIDYIADPGGKLVLALALLIGSASLLGGVGKAIGLRVFRFVRKVQVGHHLDGIAGAAFSALVTLVIVWLFAAVLSGTPFRGINQHIRDSRIIRATNERLPPAPAVLAKLSTLINTYGFPKVFIGPEPQPIEPVNPPSSAEVAAALEAAGTSVVRIESRACGGMMYGSGFVAAPGLVATNAHVVAGVRQPEVVDRAGRHRATVVYFDPDLDLAIVRADNLAGRPLPLDGASQERGTAGTVLGYPGGGPLEAVPAAVLQEITARGRNIYGARVVDRQVYMLQAKVEQGNSGGPVVLQDGTVIGVVFARSESEDGIGYAFTSGAVAPVVQSLQRGASTVSTGPCLAN